MEYRGAAPRTEYNVQQCKQLHKHFTPLQIKQHLVSLVPWYITLILWITSKFIVFKTMVGRLVGWLVWPPVVLLVPSDWPFVTQHQACIPNLISCSPPSPISMAYMALNLSQKAWRVHVYHVPESPTLQVLVWDCSELSYAIIDGYHSLWTLYTNQKEYVK